MPTAPAPEGHGEDGTAPRCLGRWAPAVDGRANEAVRAVIAAEFGVRRSTVLLMHGERGRDKLVELDPAPADVVARLAALTGRDPA